MLEEKCSNANGNQFLNWKIMAQRQRQPQHLQIVNNWMKRIEIEIEGDDDANADGHWAWLNVLGQAKQLHGIQFCLS